ncbi:MAG: AAA family ATPase [Actinomycetaceae bacterium]|nr:AAA family ATPase [Actinomycetaceae bacterium]
MRITRVTASNWRNFTSLDFALERRLFVVGPNAAGKSNLLDLFRFLGDIAGPGGGLASAMRKRGGLSRVRSLFSRNHRRGRLIIDVHLEDGDTTWHYRLSIMGESGGHNRPIVDEELVERGGEVLLRRPDAEDGRDPERLTQTHLEQINSNQAFRAVAEHFARVQYFHLVPQIIRDPARSGLHEGDPFGGDFIAQMNATSTRTRNAWMRRIQQALQAAVPEFESLDIEVDDAGKPHLKAGYRNWRVHPSAQYETEFSDGTLRLIGLLWTVIKAPSGAGALLLEEPELSLNSAIVRLLPSMLASAQRSNDLQVLVSTHAPAILDDEGIAPEEVLLLRVTDNGTDAKLLSSVPEAAGDVELGLPLSDIVGALIAPHSLDGLLAATRGKRS